MFILSIKVVFFVENWARFQNLICEEYLSALKHKRRPDGRLLY